MSVTALPESVRTLFPTEQLDFASSITSEEVPALREVFGKHKCFSECGEMIGELNKIDKHLGERMVAVLEGNKKRISGLSPNATDFAKEIITMVTHTLCALTLGTPINDQEAKRLHEKFQQLPAADQEALKKNNPDIKF